MTHAIQYFDTEQEQWITFEHICGATDHAAKLTFHTVLKTRVSGHEFRDWRLVQLKKLDQASID